MAPSRGLQVNERAGLARSLPGRKEAGVGTWVSLHTGAATSRVQKTVNTSHGTLDRNTVLRGVPDRRAGASPEKPREMDWKGKRRQSGLYEEWTCRKKMVLVKGALAS